MASICINRFDATFLYDIILYHLSQIYFFVQKYMTSFI